MFNHNYIGHWLGVTSNALKRRSEHLLDDFGLTMKQFGLLNSLYKENRLTSRELSARNASDSSTIMAIVDQLEKKGYLKREPSLEDRRIKHLVLTQKALENREAIVSRADSADKAIRAELSEEEVEGLKSTLQKILTFSLNPVIKTDDGVQSKENT